ncbi:PREDICTED: sugar transporter SWEET1-like [Diuraphis noxia]|uniref:sugar transporter SWEET1-like n=1 Tax=Diuraphis noxia TaxID=143948 RepID=UPI0007638B2F|nr:PREDICTED: sugar transporter SWEET1-like [Diuraphis noxia]
MDIYEVYVKAVSFAAGCASTAMMLTPLLVCKDIVKKKTSDHVNLSTFVGALFRSSLFYRQGFILNLQTVMFVHGMGLLINTLYLALYWYYSNKKTYVIKTVFKTALLSSVFLIYSFIESTDLVVTRFPIMVSFIHLSLIGWPLLSIRETIRTKKWSGHPKPILINSIVLCILWLLYSVNIKNVIIFTQCSVALILSSAQLGLWAIYPAEKIQSNKMEKHE